MNRLEFYYYYLILYSVRTATANRSKQSGILGCRSTALSEAKSLRTGTLELKCCYSLESECLSTVIQDGVLQKGVNCISTGLTVIERCVRIQQSEVQDKAYVLHLHIITICKCGTEMHKSASSIEGFTSSRCIHVLLKHSTASAIKVRLKSCIYFEDRCVFSQLHLHTVPRERTAANQTAKKLLKILQHLHCHSNHSSISNIPCTEHS